MKRILSFSFVFFFFLGLFSVDAFAATVDEYKSFAASNGIKNFIIAKNHLVVTTSQPQVYTDRNFQISKTAVYSDDNDTNEITSVNFPTFYFNKSDVSYSTYDLIDPTTGDVFFSAPLPIPMALLNLLPFLVEQAMKILPVAILIMAMLMGVSLISRVLYRYL